MPTKTNTSKKTEIYEEYRVKECRICGSAGLTEYLSLGTMPIPNGFLVKEELNGPEPHYPLGVYICNNCTLSQLTHVIPADIMFRNYLYIPSTSKTMVQHFEAMAADAVKRFNVKPGDLVVDIGSNDGTLLKFFKAHEAQVLGIDPASNLAMVARLNGINTLDDFFGSKIAKEVASSQGKAKVITATNVVAHVHDIHDFFKGISELLNKDGVFVGEFPYGKDMHDKNEFDTIYHEHLSYFSIHSIQALFERHQLKLVDIVKQRVHGGSVRVIVAHQNSDLKPTSAIKEFLDAEVEAGMKTPEYYAGFAKRVEKIKEDLTSLLKKLRKDGKRIIGYGAAAKGNVTLNYCQIGTDLIEYIVDSVPYKQGRFTPGTHVPIFPELKLEKDNPDYVLLLAWNFADEIMQKQEAYRQKGGQFIIAIPNVRVE